MTVSTNSGQRALFTRQHAQHEYDKLRRSDPLEHDLSVSWKYFWPELDINYEYWPNGEHQGLTQVMLTPGIILGRFGIGMDAPTRPIKLILRAGYQVAVTPNPVTQRLHNPFGIQQRLGP